MIFDPVRIAKAPEVRERGEFAALIPVARNRADVEEIARRLSNASAIPFDRGHCLKWVRQCKHRTFRRGRLNARQPLSRLRHRNVRHTKCRVCGRGGVGLGENMNYKSRE